MADPTLATTAARFSAFVDVQTARDAQLRDWAAGVVTGGPSADGYYPLTDSTGTTLLLPCIALLTALVVDADLAGTLADITTQVEAAASSAAGAAAAVTAAAEANAAGLVLIEAQRAAAEAARLDALNAAAAAAFNAQSIPGLLSALSALAERVRVLEEGTIIVTFAPSLDFSDARNSQYL